jgi:hypothetical protein
MLVYSLFSWWGAACRGMMQMHCNDHLIHTVTLQWPLRCLACLVMFISMFRLMLMFASCFPMGKALGWVTFPKYRAGYHLALGPLFWEWPHSRDFTLHLKKKLQKYHNNAPNQLYRKKKASTQWNMQNVKHE